MNIHIKHKHAGHLIVIEGQPFRANDAGQWDLTEIWQTLKLSKGKAPGRWRGKDKDRLLLSQNLDVQNLGKTGQRILATKRATIEYAGWVSDEFKDMVFDAFEAILEMPDVAAVVGQRMAELGREKSAELLARNIFNDKCDWKALGRRTPKRLTAEQKLIQKYQRQANAEARKAHMSGREGM